MDSMCARIPPPLPAGATIGIIAPSGTIRNREDFYAGVRILNELGFQTTFPPDLWPGPSYLADSDARRLQEFLELWHDPEVDCLMAARGGYGALRIAGSLSHAHPHPPVKFFVGFSDCTLIHDRFFTSHRLASIHGPVVTSLARLDRASLTSLQNALLLPIETWEFTGPVEVLRESATLRGVSSGGNLSTIVSTLGTALAPDWQGKIVFLEDTGETIYRLDRMLTQLHLSGILEKAAAVVLGDFTHGLKFDGPEALQHHEALRQRVLELTSDTTAVWARFPMGHGAENHCIPMGVELELDSGLRRISVATEHR